MAREDRDAHARARDQEVGKTQDLARLVAELLLLVGLLLAVVDDRPGERHHVERDVARELVRRGERDRAARVHQTREVLLGPGDRLVAQLGRTGQPRARDRLVRRHDQALETGLVRERLEDRHRGHRGAVRVRDDALARLVDRFRVDLGHDERDVRVHAPRRGVVDHDDARCGIALGLRLGRRAARGEQGDVEARDVGRGRVLDDDVLTLPGQGAARGARRGEVADLRDGEVALLEQAAHDGAHLTGRPDDADDEACRVLVAHGGLLAQRPVPA
ncbi:hypothetical protein D3C74_323420 [compost metagenome]